VSELLPAAQCCCTKTFSGLTWFEVHPLVLPQQFYRGFETWGLPAPRFLALFNYDTIPEDYVFYGSIGQFWRLGSAVCSVQDYIDEGGTYINPPQENGAFSQGDDPEFWGCGFEYPDNLIVTPYGQGGGPPGNNLPQFDNYEVSGINVTDLNGTSPTNIGFGPYGIGNLLTSAWSATPYFFPNMNEVEPEFMDISLTQDQTGRGYRKRFTPAQKVWDGGRGGGGDVPVGRTKDNPHAALWYNIQKYVLDRGTFQFGMEWLGGLQGNITCNIGLNVYNPPWNPEEEAECCGWQSTTPFECSVTLQGTWGGTATNVTGPNSPTTPLGTVCAGDGYVGSSSASATLIFRGDQVVQVSGPDTELAIPQDGMGDSPRLLDPIILQEGFFWTVKYNVFGCFPPEILCEQVNADCDHSTGTGGPGYREWRVEPTQLFGEAGQFFASDSVLAQVEYILFGGQVVPADPTFFGNYPVIQNAHSPVNGLLMAQIVYGAVEAANPGSVFLPGCSYSSGSVCRKRIGKPPCPPEICCGSSDPNWDLSQNCIYSGFSISEISVSY